MKTRKILITIEMETGETMVVIKDVARGSFQYYGTVNQVEVSMFQPVKVVAKKVK